MKSGKAQRVATATGFLSGVIACMDALRDVKVLWPPDLVWSGLRPPQRLELGGGIALVVATLVVWIVRSRPATRPY